MNSPTGTFLEIEPNYSLRPYQKTAVDAVLQELHKSGKVLLHAPTGAGKTRMGMAVVTAHMRRKNPTMVLWLAPTQELVEQAAEAFHTAWTSHGDIYAVVIQWHGGGEKYSHGMGLKRNTMLVASLQMAVQSTTALKECLQLLQNKVSLIVFDEAHQSPAPTYRELLERIMETDQTDCLLLGLSATPGRADEGETKELSEMYGGHKVNIAGSENPIKFLVSNGYLANANFVLHPTDYGVAPNPRPDISDDYSLSDLHTLGDIDARNRQIVEIVAGLFADGHKRVLVFTPSVSSALDCARICKEDTDIEYANAVYGDLPTNQRKHIIGNYRALTDDINQPQVIFNFNVLTAGVDVPQTSAVIIGKPTKSDVRIQQMIGRAVRGPKSGGNKEAYIHIITDEKFTEFIDLAKLYSTWEKLWEPEESS